MSANYQISEYQGYGARPDECIVKANGVKVYGPASRDYCESWIARKVNPDLAGRGLAELSGPHGLRRLLDLDGGA